MTTNVREAAQSSRRCSECDVETDRLLLTLKGYTCTRCGRRFCGAHAFLLEEFEGHDSGSPAVDDSCVCIGCLAKLWDEPVEGEAQGAIARTWDFLRRAARRVFKGDPKDKQKLRPGALDAWLSRKSATVLKHDRDVTLEYVVEDLREFAHFYAGSQGRDGAGDLSLADVYRLVDWMRGHPAIPDFLHDVSWKTIENTGAGLGFAVDAFKVVMTVKTGGALAAGFNLRPALETAAWGAKETTGKSLLTHAYDSVFAKLGLNLNPRRAFVHWLAGKLVVELYRRKGSDRP